MNRPGFPERPIAAGSAILVLSGGFWLWRGGSDSDVLVPVGMIAGSAIVIAIGIVLLINERRDA